MRDESAMLRGKQAYVQTQFNTVGQDRLLLLLYDGALKFLTQARERILQGDVGGKGVFLSKALDVLTELTASLNQEVGGELAKNLRQLYLLCSAKLLRANLTQNLGLIDEVSVVLTDLREAYAQIMNQPEVQAAAQQIAMRQSAAATQTSRPLTPQAAIPAGVGQAQARAAYGQKASAAYGQAQFLLGSNRPKA